ncbi:MAG TPA: alpha/beta fold hydrolase [Opitutaceae bacterium]|nr:alpha/beta fold hydrolase [Opitutaceae bacterium]HND61374.1 alpha/beta fold hydrolase [Opitutaceae bacterium]
MSALRRSTRAGLVVLLLLLQAGAALAARADETVVLLHGLGLRSWAMARLAHALERDGYRVVNLSYPSRTLPLEEIAGRWLPEQLVAAGVAPGQPVSFVTHSMGGIVVRQYRHEFPAAPIGRVVMIAPPNQGSEVADRLHDFTPFRWFMGDNALRLGTGRDSVPLALGPWPGDAGELGVIAGDRSLNPLFSAWIGAPNDGKVAVERTKLAGMADFVVVHHSHTWLQWCDDTFAQVRAFLHEGRFQHGAAAEPLAAP